MLPTGSDSLPTAPFGDFNNAILGFLHARPLELLFGVPVLILLVISAIMLAAMLRQSR
ncbi:MAG TPA: hypothetical protein VIE36_15405 [Methylomirabilota bacterium]|jgi:hypothetical protein